MADETKGGLGFPLQGLDTKGTDERGMDSPVSISPALSQQGVEVNAGHCPEIDFGKVNLQPRKITMTLDATILKFEMTQFKK